jgi:hypothetical protein
MRKQVHGKIDKIIHVDTVLMEVIIWGQKEITWVIKYSISELGLHLCEYVHLYKFIFWCLYSAVRFIFTVKFIKFTSRSLQLYFYFWTKGSMKYYIFSYTLKQIRKTKYCEIMAFQILKRK